MARTDWPNLTSQRPDAHEIWRRRRGSAACTRGMDGRVKRSLWYRDDRIRNLQGGRLYFVIFLLSEVEGGGP